MIIVGSVLGSPKFKLLPSHKAYRVTMSLPLRLPNVFHSVGERIKRGNNNNIALYNVPNIRSPKEIR